MAPLPLPPGRVTVIVTGAGAVVACERVHANRRATCCVRAVKAVACRARRRPRGTRGARAALG